MWFSTNLTQDVFVFFSVVTLIGAILMSLFYRLSCMCAYDPENIFIKGIPLVVPAFFATWTVLVLLMEYENLDTIQRNSLIACIIILSPSILFWSLVISEDNNWLGVACLGCLSVPLSIVFIIFGFQTVNIGRDNVNIYAYGITVYVIGIGLASLWLGGACCALVVSIIQRNPNRIGRDSFVVF